MPDRHLRAGWLVLVIAMAAVLTGLVVWLTLAATGRIDRSATAPPAQPPRSITLATVGPEVAAGEPATLSALVIGDHAVTRVAVIIDGAATEPVDANGPLRVDFDEPGEHKVQLEGQFTDGGAVRSNEITITARAASPTSRDQRSTVTAPPAKAATLLSTSSTGDAGATPSSGSTR